MKNPLKTLEANTAGRDFVIGDLHGSFTAFENLMRNIKFNPEVDRMISVGDLVDRGPHSLWCLSLILEPWFHAVLSNHEQMMIEKFSGGYMGNYWFQNGGQWGIEAYNDYKAVYMDHVEGRIPSDSSYALIDLLSTVEELPFLITVNTKSGKKFHVLHAELPVITGIITDADLADPDTVAQLAVTQQGDGDSFLWGRHVFYSFYGINLDNREITLNQVNERSLRVFNDHLSHIISGHTIVTKPLTIVGQTNIDTGAYNSYHTAPEPYTMNSVKRSPWAALTCVELDTWTFYQATETDFSIVDPVIITREDLNV